MVPDVTVPDVLKMIKEEVPVEESLLDGDGKMHMYQRTYMNETDIAKFNFRDDSRGLRSLAEFMDKSRDKESDLYKAYVKARELLGAQADAPPAVDEQQLSDLYSEAKENLVKAPDLASYYERQATGKSVIDDFSGVDYEREQEDEEINRLQAEEGDEEAYRRELLSRLFGGKLTARQYAVLMNMPDDELQRAKMEQQQEEKMKIHARDEIRNGEELLESHRRQKVLTGEWSEAESHLLL